MISLVLRFTCLETVRSSWSEQKVGEFQLCIQFGAVVGRRQRSADDDGDRYELPYALTGSSDGRRMVISSPLYDQGVGLVQVFSNETSKISNSDFIAPTSNTSWSYAVQSWVQ